LCFSNPCLHNLSIYSSLQPTRFCSFRRTRLRNTVASQATEQTKSRPRDGSGNPTAPRAQRPAALESSRHPARRAFKFPFPHVAAARSRRRRTTTRPAGQTPPRAQATQTASSALAPGPTAKHFSVYQPTRISVSFLLLLYSPFISLIIFFIFILKLNIKSQLASPLSSNNLSYYFPSANASQTTRRRLSANPTLDNLSRSRAPDGPSPSPTRPPPIRASPEEEGGPHPGHPDTAAPPVSRAACRCHASTAPDGVGEPSFDR
jgi:hypothetical protein